MKCHIRSETFAQRKNDILVLANHYEWCFGSYDQNSGCLTFNKKNARIRVWVSKLTVEVMLTGEKPETRKTDMTELEMLFIHPRKNFNYKNHFTKKINSLKLQRK
jgi:hypothetical protein